MKKFIVAIAFIALGIFLVNTFITGDNGTMKSEGDRIGDSIILKMKDVEKTTP